MASAACLFQSQFAKNFCEQSLKLCPASAVAGSVAISSIKKVALTIRDFMLAPSPSEIDSGNRGNSAASEIP
jgi:hypothetical protein